MSDLIITRRDGAVFELVLNRPSQRNAINDEMMNAIDAAFDQCGKRIQCRRAGRPGAGGGARVFLRH